MTTRRTSQVLSCVTALLLSATVASAQRGPGGPPGGPPGGGMGGPPMGSGERMGTSSMGSPVPRRGPQLGPSGRWWDDRRIVKAVGLRSEQQKKMDDIFNSNRSQLETLLGNLQREEQHLSSLSRDELQDENKVFAAIDRVAVARAELEKGEAHVLMLIRREMDGSQLAALDKETTRQ